MDSNITLGRQKYQSNFEKIPGCNECDFVVGLWLLKQTAWGVFEVCCDDASPEQLGSCRPCFRLGVELSNLR